MSRLKPRPPPLAAASRAGAGTQSGARGSSRAPFGAAPHRLPPPPSLQPRLAVARVTEALEESGAGTRPGQDGERRRGQGPGPGPGSGPVGAASLAAVLGAEPRCAVLGADAVAGQAGRGGRRAAGRQAEEGQEGAAAGRAVGPAGLHRRHRPARGTGGPGAG